MKNDMKTVNGIIKFIASLKSTINAQTFDVLNQDKYTGTDIAEKKFMMETFEKNGFFCFLDESNVAMCVITNPQTFAIFLGCVCSADYVTTSPTTGEMSIIGRQIVPELDYSKTDGPIISRYSCEYLRIILELAKTEPSEGLTFEMKHDYPLRVTARGYGLQFILAPRVKDD